MRIWQLQKPNNNISFAKHVSCVTYCMQSYMIVQKCKRYRGHHLNPRLFLNNNLVRENFYIFLYISGSINQTRAAKNGPDTKNLEVVCHHDRQESGRGGDIFIPCAVQKQYDSVFTIWSLSQVQTILGRFVFFPNTMCFFNEGCDGQKCAILENFDLCLSRQKTNNELFYYSIWRTEMWHCGKFGSLPAMVMDINNELFHSRMWWTKMCCGKFGSLPVTITDKNKRWWNRCIYMYITQKVDIMSNAKVKH